MGESGQQTDESLMRQVADGQADALRALFFRFAPSMLAIGHRMLGRNGGADDVLNEVFLEVWQKAERFDPARGSVRAYLLLLMRSRCLDCLRARRSRPDMNTQSDGNHHAAGAGPPPHDAIQLDEERARVRGALAALDVDQRKAIELSFYEGLSHRQIAEHLNQPVGTIKGRLRSGLIKLRHSLRMKGGD